MNRSDPEDSFRIKCKEKRLCCSNIVVVRGLSHVLWALLWWHSDAAAQGLSRGHGHQRRPRTAAPHRHSRRGTVGVFVCLELQPYCTHMATFDAALASIMLMLCVSFQYFLVQFKAGSIRIMIATGMDCVCCHWFVLCYVGSPSLRQGKTLLTRSKFVTLLLGWMVPVVLCALVAKLVTHMHSVYRFDAMLWADSKRHACHCSRVHGCPTNPHSDVAPSTVFPTDATKVVFAVGGCRCGRAWAGRTRVEVCHQPHLPTDSGGLRASGMWGSVVAQADTPLWTHWKSRTHYTQARKSHRNYPQTLQSNKSTHKHYTHCGT